jgi:serine/threonine protein kinase
MTQTNPIDHLKIIDFGSCIQFNTLSYDSINITTPEYTPPELLDTNNRPSPKNAPVSLQDSLLHIYKNTNSVYKVDIWSLGVIILEIISAIPMWISYKCIFKRKGKDMLGTGLFSNINRSFDKIIVIYILFYFY